MRRIRRQGSLAGFENLLFKEAAFAALRESVREKLKFKLKVPQGSQLQRVRVGADRDSGCQ